MNGPQQKARHTAVSCLERQVHDAQTLLIAIDDRLAKLAKVTIKAIDDERQRSDERWIATSAATKRLGDRLQAFASKTFRERLRWIATGR